MGELELEESIQRICARESATSKEKKKLEKVKYVCLYNDWTYSIDSVTRVRPKVLDLFTRYTDHGHASVVRGKLFFDHSESPES